MITKVVLTVLLFSVPAAIIPPVTWDAFDDAPPSAQATFVASAILTIVALFVWALYGIWWKL